MSNPRRAVTLELAMQADTRADLIADLRHIIERIEREDMSTGCMSGPDSHYTHRYHEHDGPTHAEYFRQVNDWLADRKGIDA